MTGSSRSIAAIAAAGALLVLVLALMRAGGTEAVAPPDDLSAECGAPTPAPEADRALVPEAFLPTTSAVVDTSRKNQSLNAALTVSLEIQGALEFYRDAVASEGYEVISEDNEGFEAELYIKRGGELGGVRIRPTLCSHVALIHITLNAPLTPRK